jgi:hypothetical protein
VDRAAALDDVGVGPGGRVAVETGPGAPRPSALELGPGGPNYRLSIP